MFSSFAPKMPVLRAGRRAWVSPLFLSYMSKTNLLDQPNSVPRMMRSMSSINYIARGNGTFFKATNTYGLAHNLRTPVYFLSKQTLLQSTLDLADRNLSRSYLGDSFTRWTSLYVTSAPKIVEGYFSGEYSFDYICRDFIKFCFAQDIKLDPQKTLQSFKAHNELSDEAVKKELIKLPYQEKMNLLGFGLDDGSYEKELAQYLIKNNIAKSVNIYGLDPYANQGKDIVYLKLEQLSDSACPKFDLIMARWVLHHVELKNRWQDLVSCINKTNPQAKVLIVEHGFLNESHTPQEQKLFYFLNATFDIVANIGLRPSYFTNSAPDIGANFFVQYLIPDDFKSIQSNVIGDSEIRFEEVGPGFPNQTVCTIQKR